MNQYQESLNIDAMKSRTKAIVPIFVWNNEINMMSFNGSCILIKIGNRSFILTATHVVDRFEPEDIYSVGKKDYVSLFPVLSGFHYSEGADFKMTDLSI